MAGESEAQGEAKLVEQLVGSVLSSIVKAQGLAASQLVEMIDVVGFEPSGEGQPKRARTFTFDFFRSEVDETTNEIVRKKVTATVPLLTLINLPSIAIHEATIQMDLRLVAHAPPEAGAPTDPEKAPLKLFAVPARKQLVRTAKEAIPIDAAGTIKLQVTMRQEQAVGLDKIQSLLESGTEELVLPELPPSAPEPGGEEPSPSNQPSAAEPRAAAAPRRRRPQKR